MSGNADVFKSRLAQLKKVLERDGKMPENLFYAALQLDETKELKAGVSELLDKHQFKVKKGYIFLANENEDRQAVVKDFLKDAFEFLLKAFGVEKAQLVPKKSQEQKPSAALRLFEMQEAFELTMKDLDSIDTSTPLESIVHVAPTPPDSSADELEQKPANITATADVVKRVQASGGTEKAPSMPEESTKKLSPPAIPTPPAQPSKIPTKEEQIAVAAGEQAKPKSVPKLILTAPNLVPSPPKPAPSAPAAVPSPPAQETKIVPKPPAEAITYEYYVCSRCGAEISKMEIRQAGVYLECPRCMFNFSKGEATIIHKKPAETTKQIAASTGGGMAEKDATTIPFDLFSDSKPDESLIRPSDLFKDRQKEMKSQQQTEAGAQESGTIRVKPRAITPRDRLVRPSEFLGLKPKDASSTQIQARESTQENPTTSQPIPEPKKVDRLVKPSDLREAALEKKATEGQCPKCGSTKFAKVQDRSKIISYNPLVFGYKKKCMNCTFEFG
nr:hypothetical protein [Candidatus Sigynarchaeota archaeon]